MVTEVLAAVALWAVRYAMKAVVCQEVEIPCVQAMEEMGRWPPSGKHLSVSPLRARTLKGTGLGW